MGGEVLGKGLLLKKHQQRERGDGRALFCVDPEDGPPKGSEPMKVSTGGNQA